MFHETVAATGDAGEHVTALQEHLLRLGHYTGRVDGEFGPATEEAVLRFQELNGHERDGRVGSLTWEELARQEQAWTEQAAEEVAAVQWSEDGRYWWDGTDWQAADARADTVAEPVAEVADSAEALLSEDGLWQWDGNDWQPTSNELGAPAAAKTKTRTAGRSKADAILLVGADIEPKDCFIEFKSTKIGWGPIDGTGCAHWVSHQRGAPTGTAHVCDAGFKYRVTEVLATLTKLSAGLSGAVVGAVWQKPTGSHIGIVRAVTRDPKGVVVSVEVENDSSESGGVVTQTKTDGAIWN